VSNHESGITNHAPSAAGTADGLGPILQALEFAAHKHRDQRRKDAQASPYINHPIALANVLVREGGVTDPVVIAAALLHDTLEDTQTTSAELRETFGDRIAGIVEEVTDDQRLLKAERKRLQIEHAAHISREAKLVKLADKICNVRDVAVQPPAKWDLARRREYFDWAKAVVDRMRGVHPELERKFDEAYALKP
jgi:guanosine-3',5'-bis(diphosphate) 3'-pyrophosphohydrolase